MSEEQQKPSAPTNDEVDLGHLLEVLDTALSSDNPAVKDQLQKLLMIATLVSSENPQKRLNGPLSNIFDEMRRLRDRLARVENQIDQLRGTRGMVAGDYPKRNPDAESQIAGQSGKTHKPMMLNYLKDY